MQPYAYLLCILLLLLHQVLEAHAARSAAREQKAKDKQEDEVGFLPHCNFQCSHLVSKCVGSVRISSTNVCMCEECSHLFNKCVCVCVSVSVSVCAVCCLLRVCVCSHLFNKCVCVCGAFSDVSASVDHPALEGTDHRSREEAVRVLSVLMTFGRQPGVRATTTNGLEKLFGRSCATIRTPAKTVLQCPRGTFQTPDCRGTWGPHALFVGS